MDSYWFLIAYLICVGIIACGAVLMDRKLKKDPRTTHTPLGSTVVGIGFIGIFVTFLIQLKLWITSLPAINHLMRQEAPILAFCITLCATTIYLGTLDDALLHGSPDGSEWGNTGLLCVLSIGVLCLGFVGLVYM